MTGTVAWPAQGPKGGESSLYWPCWTGGRYTEVSSPGGCLGGWIPADEQQQKNGRKSQDFELVMVVRKSCYLGICEEGVQKGSTVWKSFGSSGTERWGKVAGWLAGSNMKSSLNERQHLHLSQRVALSQKNVSKAGISHWLLTLNGHESVWGVLGCSIYFSVRVRFSIDLSGLHSTRLYAELLFAFSVTPISKECQCTFQVLQACL